MRIAADGYIDLTDARRVRTPGFHHQDLPPVPEGEAIAFLLSHTFPGHRRIVRALTVEERKKIRLALWADSVSERMAVVDRIWRSVTEEMPAPADPREPRLVQVVRYRDRSYPIFHVGSRTRMIPDGLPRRRVARKLVVDLEQLADASAPLERTA